MTPSPGPARLESTADVLVVGGGTAGTIAALQAARLGARTIVAEMGPQLGGTMTTGGVNHPGLFHAWGRQIIAGIGWELVRAAVDMDTGQWPDFSVIPPRHSLQQVRINGPLYAALAEEACLQAGVGLCYYETVAAVAREGNAWRVETVGKCLRRTIRCRQIVDCTGDADVVGLLGLPRQREEEIQPGTLRFQFTGYDLERIDQADADRRWWAAVAEGRVLPSDIWHTDQGFSAFLRAGASANHILGADCSTSQTWSAANVAGRQTMLRLLRFARSLPGGEKTRLASCAVQTAIRETWRIVGETVITVEDYRAGRMYDDAVCYAFYPVDLHDENGVKPEPLEVGVVPTVPLRALVPAGSRDLIVAGRCLSSDRLANSALRVEATCMATGQAAGAAAAVAAQMGVTPLEVPLADLRAVLQAHGAIVP